MKRSFHICLSSDDEVMFRDEEDYDRGFNYFALALHKTNSTGLVESFMSTHVHLLAQCEYPEGLIGAFRMPYTKYFNHKYGRMGRLGEMKCFVLEINGLHHHLAAISYILRNALHHGVVSIPYAYPHSSVNVIFQKEMGKRPIEDLISPSSYYRHIGRRADFPDSYKMGRSGLFLRESVLDIPQVENMFATPRAFDYYMSRKTSEDWVKEQSKDNNGMHPITLETIESNVSMNPVDQMLVNESGRGNYRRITDIELCGIIDKIVREDFGKPSVYFLSPEEKISIANRLHKIHYPTNAQLQRCLVMV